MSEQAKIIRSALLGLDFANDYEPALEALADLESQLAEKDKEIEQLRTDLQTAVWRIKDMLKGDDGQAWKEAERFLQALKGGDE